MGRDHRPDDEETRREGLSVQAIDPFDGTQYELTIRHERIQAMRLRGKGAIQEAAYLVEYVLQHPRAIFRGLRRDEDEPRHEGDGTGWLCYCAIPPRAYDRDGNEIPPYRRKVYLVFVTDEEIVYNWRWDQADADEQHLPHDHENRFRERLL